MTEGILSLSVILRPFYFRSAAAASAVENEQEKNDDDYPSKGIAVKDIA